MSPKPRIDLSGFRARGPESAEPDEPEPVDVAEPPPPPTVPKIVPPPPAEDNAPPGSSRQRTGDDGPRSRRPRKTKPASAPAAEGRQRILVNIPVSVSRAAKQAAADQNVYLSEYVLTAFGDQADGLRKEFARPTKRGSDNPFAAPTRHRQRNVEDPSQLVFTAPPTAAAAIDDLADECRLTRSALVTIVLERQLGLVADAT